MSTILRTGVKGSPSTRRFIRIRIVSWWWVLMGVWIAWRGVTCWWLW